MFQFCKKIHRSNENEKQEKQDFFNPVQFLASSNLTEETKPNSEQNDSIKTPMLISMPSQQSAIQLDLKWEIIVFGKTKDQIEMTKSAREYLVSLSDKQTYSLRGK